MPRWVTRAASRVAVLLTLLLLAVLPAPGQDGSAMGDLFTPAPAPTPEELLARHPLADATLEPREQDPAPATIPSNARLPFPFVTIQDDGRQSLVAFHPLFSVFKDRETGLHEVHVLWPFVRYNHRPEWWREHDRRDFSVFPLWWNRWGEREGVTQKSQVFIPFYFGGVQGDTRYAVLFPFVWWSDGAKVPLFFPPRPQHFAAIWPLAGEFRGYWNRDVVQWVLWPLFVRSWKGEGADRFHQHTLLWPFFSVYTGEKVSGFRVWPLASVVSKQDAFTRGYFLWPFGHFRNEQPNESGRFQKGILFFPFYADWRTRDFRYRMYTPLHGTFDSKGRSVRGWVLGAYNQDDNHRVGTRRHRLLWFLFTWGTEIPIKPEFLEHRTEAEIRAAATKGGGFFPFYVVRHSNRMKREHILWPLFYRRWNAYPDGSTYDRFAIAYTFYYSGVERGADGTKKVRQMLWPFYRKRVEPDGRRRENILHMFPLVDIEHMDRNWTPLLSFWTRESNPATREKRERWLGGAYQFDRDWRGVERRRLDTLVFSHEHTWGKRRPSESRTRLLGGLIGRHRVGQEVQTELFWRKF